MKTLEEYIALPYRIEIIPDMIDGGYAACIPELRGCVAVGDDLTEVVSALRIAKKNWIERAISEGREIPEPNPNFMSEIMAAAEEARRHRDDSEWRKEEDQ